MKPDNDEELYDLFSSFDSVSASDELKSSTIDSILASADAARQEGEDAESHVEHGEFRVVKSASALSGPSSRQGRKAKRRAIRIAALAACLTLALTGGIAWATPVSHVEVTQDDTTIDLGVNCFGVTVTAEANDQDGNDVIAEEGLRNVSRDEAVERAAGALAAKHPDRAVEIDGEPRGGETERMSDGEAQPGSAGNGEQSGSANGKAQPASAGAAQPSSAGAAKPSSTGGDGKQSSVAGGDAQPDSSGASQASSPAAAKLDTANSSSQGNANAPEPKAPDADSENSRSSDAAQPSGDDSPDSAAAPPDRDGEARGK